MVQIPVEKMGKLYQCANPRRNSMAVKKFSLSTDDTKYKNWKNKYHFANEFIFLN